MCDPLILLMRVALKLTIVDECRFDKLCESLVKNVCQWQDKCLFVFIFLMSQTKCFDLKATIR